MIQDYNDVAERYGCNQMMEINPDEDMRRWCVQQTITLLANADYYYTKSEVDKIIEEIQGMTPEQVQAMINRSIASKANQSDLETLSAQVGSNSERLLNTYTKQETNAAITAATDALAQNIAQRGYQTSGDVQNAISGKADTTAVTEAISEAVSGKADTTAITQVSDTLTAHTANTNIHVTAEDKTAWNAKADISDIPSVSGYADSVMYNSTSKYVEFYHGGTSGTKVFEYDASPFLIDGMVESVVITSITSGASEVQVLEITWNSAAGGQVTDIPLSEIFDPSNYYTKTDTDTKISEATSGKADTTAVTQAISEAVSGKADTTAVTQSISEAVSGKQDTLSAGTNITIVDNVISASGKAIEAGRGIAITTGTTADTVAFNLPISGGTGQDSIIESWTENIAWGNGSHAEGINTQALGQGSHAEGEATTASSQFSHAEGHYTKALNAYEHASGEYNVSNTGTTKADKTLFSVGNGFSNNTRHNAFEIRQNGDIYLTKDGQDVKLQDQLGGGISSGEVQTMIDESISGKVDTSAFTAYTASTDSRIGEDEEVTAAALNVLDDKIDAVSGDVITISGAIPTTTSAVTSGSTAALTSGGAYTQFDGMKLKKLTQSQYDALAPNYDASTLYVIVN